MITRRSVPAVCVLLAAICGAADVRAGTLWETSDGETVVEGRAFYKSLGTVLRLPDGLVDGTQELARAIAASGAPVPPITPIPSVGATTSQWLRMSGRLLKGGDLAISFGWQLALTVASDPVLAGVGGIGGLGNSGSVATTTGGAGTSSSRRLVDFDPILLSSGGLRVLHNLDLLSVQLRLPIGELIVGRQLLAWGSGRFWNPTDVLSPFAPTDVDREVRRGIDALRWTVPFNETSFLDVLWLPQQVAADNGGVVRAQANVRGWDVAASAGKYARDLVGGLDLTGELSHFGVHAEGAYTVEIRGLDGPAPSIGEQFFRGVVGAEWRPAEAWVLVAEYLYDGHGSTDPAEYLAILRSDRVVRGELQGAGRHRAGLAVSWAESELLAVNLVVLGNLTDPSALLAPSLEWWFAQDVLVRAGASVPIGRGADATALRRITGADVATGSAAFSEAVRTMGIRSEYGVSPIAVFMQAGIYR